MKAKSVYDPVREATVMYRAKRRISQRQLAEMVGVSQATICDWERPGGCVMREEAMTRLLDLLDIETPQPIQRRQPSIIMAERLRALVDFLESPVFSERQKVEEIKRVVESLQDIMSVLMDSAGK